MHAAPIRRRDFLRRSAVWGATLPLFGLARRASALEGDLVARRVFFDNPDYSRVSLSPDGKHLAYLAPLDGVSNLWVAPVDDPKAGQAGDSRHRPQPGYLFPVGVHQPPFGFLPGARRR